MLALTSRGRNVILVKTEQTQGLPFIVQLVGPTLMCGGLNPESGVGEENGAELPAAW